MVRRNKRYIFWFWVLNLTFAEFGASAFRGSAHASMDHSLYAGGLVHGFDASVLLDLLMRPETGPMQSMTAPAGFFVFLFFAATALFLPGVFTGYASNYRLPRTDFFRACGRNLWRFIRLLIVSGIVMGIIAGVLFSLSGAIVKKAGESTNELLPFELQMTGLAIIFLIMTTLRIWFDLAEAETVLSDRRAVRKSLSAAFRHTFRSLGSLLGCYVLTTIIAAFILVGGLWIWNRLVRPENVIGAFLIAQITLFLLLIPRFWQRGVAVQYWREKMQVPVAVVPQFVAEPVVPSAVPVAPATELPAIPSQTLPSPPRPLSS